MNKPHYFVGQLLRLHSHDPNEMFEVEEIIWNEEDEEFDYVIRSKYATIRGFGESSLIHYVMEIKYEKLS